MDYAEQTWPRNELSAFSVALQVRETKPDRHTRADAHLVIADSSTMAHQCVVLVIMKERYFDDIKAGDRFKSEPLSVTEKELIEFAHKFDPQMFHLSRRRAERSIFKGLIASGWHTAAMSMRLFVQTLNFAEGAIGLGVDELRWPNAVRPGDKLTVETEILELRPSRSRPGHGIIRLRNVTTNQRGEVVQTMLASAMVPRREQGGAKR